MKKVLLSLFSLIILANMTIASDWQFFKKAGSQKFFVDYESIEKIKSFWEGTKVYYWLKETNEYGDYSVSQIGLSCSDKTIWKLTTYYYLSTNEAVGQENTQVIQKYLIAPDTIAMRIFNEYCKNN